MHKGLTVWVGHADACLSFQHLGGRDRRFTLSVNQLEHRVPGEGGKRNDCVCPVQYSF